MEPKMENLFANKAIFCQCYPLREYQLANEFFLVVLKAVMLILLRLFLLRRENRCASFVTRFL